MLRMRIKRPFPASGLGYHLEPEPTATIVHCHNPEAETSLVGMYVRVWLELQFGRMKISLVTIDISRPDPQLFVTRVIELHGIATRGKRSRGEKISEQPPGVQVTRPALGRLVCYSHSMRLGSVE